MYRYTLLLFFAVVSMFSLWSQYVWADETLKVGIKPSEPWVMYDADIPEEMRQPRGFSIDLWAQIAANLGVKTEWVYYDSTKTLVDQTQKDEVDVGISAITILAEREKQIDFSNSMYELGLQIMVSPENQSSNPVAILLQELGKLLSWKVLFWFVLMLLVTAHLRLWVDRRDIEHSFLPKTYLAGIREALWWGLTMLITWETPKSRGFARVIDLSWHLIGLIAMSIVTAVVTAALTSKAISGSIQSEQDLPGKAVAAVATDAPRSYLEKIGADVVPVASLNEGIDLLTKGEVDALVHDGPRLAYLAKQLNEKAKTNKVLVLPIVFNPQNYGLIFPSESPWIEKVNRVLLSLRESDGLEDSFHKKLQMKWIPK